MFKLSMVSSQQVSYVKQLLQGVWLHRLCSRILSGADFHKCSRHSCYCHHLIASRHFFQPSCSFLLLQCSLGIACATTIINAAYILFTLSTDSGWTFNKLSPQGVVIVLCACGLFGMCGYVLNMPAEVRRARLTAPKLHPIKRMNLLGLVSSCSCMTLLWCCAWHTSALSGMTCVYLNVLACTTLTQPDP